MTRIMTPADFRAWREAQDLSVREAAKALGLSPATVQLYERGKRFETDEAGEAVPVKIPKAVGLACAAIAAGLFDTGYVEEIIAELPRGLTSEEFRRRTQNDVNQGWGAEVREAGRRYFGRRTIR